MLQNNRRTTLNSCQKTKKNRITQYLFELDKCLQIPNDDKLIVRRQLKDVQPSLLSIFEQFRREKSYAQLQYKLRKYLQNYKTHLKRNTTMTGDKENIAKDHHQRIYSQTSQQTSYKNSLKCSPSKEEHKKKVIDLDIAELKDKIQTSISQRSFSNNNVSEKRGCSQERTKGVSIGKIQPYLDQKGERRGSVRFILKSQDKNTKEDSSNSLVLSRNLSKNKLTQDNKTNKDLSKITIRISSKPTLENCEDKPEVTPLQDITNQISYSSSIKNLLTSKIKEQKEVKRKNDNIYIRQNSQTDQDDWNPQHFFPKTQRNDKSTVLKRPAKPLHRDQQPSCQMKLFDESLPVYLKASEIQDPKEQPSVFTVRDDRAIKIVEEEDNPTPFKFDYSFKKFDLPPTPKKKVLESSKQQLESQTVIQEGYFLKKIKKIMQCKNF